MIFVYGRDKMTDKEKLSLRKHPNYPGITSNSRGTVNPDTDTMRLLTQKLPSMPALERLSGKAVGRQALCEKSCAGIQGCAGIMKKSEGS